MSRHQKHATGRPRLQPAAAPELEGIDSLGLARWAAAAASAGLSRSSAAAISGTSRRTLQRALRQHGADPMVARDLQLGEALKWEGQAGAALQEAVSRSLAWLREASANPETDARTMAAALGATVGSAHRLGEIGARRAKRLAPVEQPQGQRFDLEGFLGQIAQACSEVRQLPPEQQEAGWEQLRQQLKADQPQGQAIDVEATLVEPTAAPPCCPF
jgi:hypothetical protein